MSSPVEKSALERQVDGLAGDLTNAQAKIKELEDLLYDLHEELHRAVDPMRIALVIHNRALRAQAEREKRGLAGVEISSLEELFNLPPHEDKDA